jgi:hypothetical protein
MEFTWHIRDNTSLPSSSVRQQSAPTSHLRGPSDGDPPPQPAGDRTRMYVERSCSNCL